jgi:signal transduction histidine kinase
VIEDSAADLGHLVSHDGLAIMIEGQGALAGGEGVAPASFAPLAGWAEHGVLITRDFSRMIALPADQKSRCAGGAFLQLSEDASEYLVLMRRPYPHVVNWGGRPDPVGRIDERGVRHLEPRTSFALWQERFDDVCAPFDADDIEVLKLLRGTLASLRALERERAARAAQRAFEQQETELRMQLLQAARVSSMHELGSAFAHELNQPLTAVMNYVTACRELIRPHESNLPAELAGLMEDGLEQAERAGAIVQRLRGLIEKGELDRRQIDLSRVVAEAMELVLPIQQAEDVEIRMELDPDLPAVLADPIQIQQVIFNLVRNAIEAMAESPAKVLTLGTRALGEDAVEVWLRDTGPGLPDKVSAELFRPLVSAKASGMGIGLSLCRSIVETHGGTIRGRNWQAGAEFRFTLPAFPVGG